MGLLENKVAIITGGSKGIGLASARMFIKEGAQVIITARNEDELMAVKRELGDNLICIKADSANIEDNQKVIEKVDAIGKGIDVLFVNAGIAEGGTIDTISEEDFDRQNGTNYKGAFFNVKACLPYLNPKSSIIFTSSIAGHMGIENLSIYSATKAALLSLTKTLAAEFAKKGIRVNAISPGYIETPLAMRNNKDKLDDICQLIPLENRFGHADEIANAALFLASDMSSYMTGANLVVDGGLSSLTLGW
jgi:NAD(P)-dependent dehydrogenase (short-subunit alcohol dehydrogenase family)